MSILTPDNPNVKRLRVQYPPGTRIELVKDMEDQFTALRAGAQGTVLDVDDAGHILMNWDSGSTLSLIYNQDSFRVISGENSKT